MQEGEDPDEEAEDDDEQTVRFTSDISTDDRRLTIVNTETCCAVD